MLDVRLVDGLFNLFLACPIIILFTWSLISFLDSLPISLCPFLTAFSLTLEFAVLYYQEFLVDLADRIKPEYNYIAFCIYNYVILSSNIIRYNGLDNFIGWLGLSNAKCLVTCVVILCGIRGMKNIVGAPFRIECDVDMKLRDYVRCEDTLFHIQVIKKVKIFPKISSLHFLLFIFIIYLSLIYCFLYYNFFYYDE